MVWTFYISKLPADSSLYEEGKPWGQGKIRLQSRLVCYSVAFSFGSKCLFTCRKLAIVFYADVSGREMAILPAVSLMFESRRRRAQPVVKTSTTNEPQ